MNNQNSTVPALEIRAVTKAFGSVRAINGLNLTIRAGEFYALLGPNGAGKTTTLRMIAGLLRPESGYIRIFDVDVVEQPQRAKQPLAWIPDEPLLYDKLNAMEYLEFVAGLWGLDGARAGAHAEDLLKLLGLWDQQSMRVEAYSRGMRQKLALAGALIHDPKLLILDEPLTGLDVAAARLVKDILKDSVRDGASIVLTTHILEVAERLAERIGIIRAGELIAEGSLDELRGLRGSKDRSLEDVFLELTAETGA